MELCIDQDYEFHYTFDIVDRITAGESHLSFPWMKILMNPAENRDKKMNKVNTIF